ncbi:MAG: oxygen-independent coproporphyrinogen III oxidase-like protein [Gammaproteobacteria bacterium]|nr:oxygen-independent coproporphyrinogen III oxidase-like protein [Gammaproteobacteria bacterium]
MPSFPTPPPLSLYIHLPWCVRKCPYCDFNSHALRGELEENRYVDALLRDLTLDAPLAGGRTIETIFFGGGTPSLFSPAAITRLLAGVREHVPLAADAEITLEANPGTVELARFQGFRAAGINRLSIGVQSFDDQKLHALGRIHGRGEALRAAEAARAAGFDNFNLDLMYGLPDQDVDQALADVRTAIAASPTHLSLYQLTLEPNTLFHAQPPTLPDELTIDAMQEALLAQVAAAGYQRYEVSAYARAGAQCRHNRNYWEFGDYLGIGAGAHAKLTNADHITRLSKTRHPESYLAKAGTPAARATLHTIARADVIFEFMLNALRLCDGFTSALFSERTGLALADIEPALRLARERGLLEESGTRLRPTQRGQQFLNDLQLLFLPAPSTETH